MKENLTKKKLQAGECVFGVSLSLLSASMVEIWGKVGFDFVLIDGEHSAASEETYENLVRAAECVGITPFLCIPPHSIPLIPRFLDLGIMGIQVAHVGSAEQAQQIIRASKYYPQGQRGLGHSRSSDYGIDLRLPKYIEAANRETLISVMIEDREAVEHLKPILDVDGIDVLFVGMRDLSESLGVPGQYQHPLVTEHIQKIVSLVQASDRILGLPGNDADTVKTHLRAGARFIAIGDTTALMTKAAREFLEKVKSY